MPKIIYGTAWKKEQTAELVVQAVRNGFRAIDTAGQPKHYFEKGVGDALEKLETFGIFRKDLFLQTKFTPIAGQDPGNLPYNPKASLSEQVAQSFASSQKNLRTDFVDSLVLHSPLPWNELMEVWSALEKIHTQGGTKALGISNCYHLPVLQKLHEAARVKPSFVQNRFYADSDYDTDLRQWCLDHGVTYQSFWTLTANPHLLGSPALQEISHTIQKTPAQVLFRFLTQKGVVPLTGTRSEQHMREDLAIFEFELNQKQVDGIGKLLI